MGVNLKSLIARLNPTTRKALEGAAGLCLSRTHYDVEFEHYIVKLLDETDSDLAHILQRFEIDPSRLTGELSRSLDKLKSGNARTPAFSPSLVKMFEQAWTTGSLNYGAGEIRSGFTILALLWNEELARIIRDSSRELQKIQADVLEREFNDIVAASPEEASRPSESPPAPLRMMRSRVVRWMP